jgi:hypothetical protein
VNVILTQDRVPSVNEAVRCIGRAGDNAAGLHVAGFITDRDGGAAFRSFTATLGNALSIVVPARALPNELTARRRGWRPS